MADRGFRTFDEMVGQMQMLDRRKLVEHWKAKGLDFSRLFTKPEVAASVGPYRSEPPHHHRALVPKPEGPGGRGPLSQRAAEPSSRAYPRPQADRRGACRDRPRRPGEDR